MQDNLQERINAAQSAINGKIKELTTEEAPVADEVPVTDKATVTAAMQTLACAANRLIPGHHVSLAEELGYCAWIASYIGVEFDARKFLRGQCKDAQMIADLGKAFCAVNQRNQGNRYASSIVIHALSKYNEKSVSSKTYDLLRLLERALLMSGDLRGAETQEA